jgi:anti-anti-sigma factor
MSPRRDLAVEADPELDSRGPQPELVVTHPRGGISVVEVRCELDMQTAPALAHLLVQELSAGCRALVVDLRGCEFLGSSGLAALVEGKHRADSRSTSMVLAATNRSAVRALQVTGLESMFETYPSTDDAVSALNG